MIDIIIITAALLFLVAWLGWHFTDRRLRNLRNNCFVTNEKGHRVRYRDASVEVRERAERN